MHRAVSGRAAAVAGRSARQEGVVGGNLAAAARVCMRCVLPPSRSAAHTLS